MKKIKLNKIKLGLSLLGIIGATTMVAPILVSCGNNTSTDNNGGGGDIPTLPSPDVNKAIFGSEKPTIQKLKDFFIKPVELVKADDEIFKKIKALKNIQIDRELLKTLEWWEGSSQIPMDIVVKSINKSIVGTNYEIINFTNDWNILNKKYNYITTLNTSIQIDNEQVSKEDLEFIKDKNNWEPQPIDPVELKQYKFDNYIKDQKKHVEAMFKPRAFYISYWMMKLGELKLITPNMELGIINIIKYTPFSISTIFISNSGELIVPIMKKESTYKIYKKMMDFYKEFGPDSMDSGENWPEEEKNKFLALQFEHIQTIENIDNYVFQKSKPLNFDKNYKEEVNLIKSIVLKDPTTTVDVINNAKDKLALFNIELNKDFALVVVSIEAKQELIKDIKALLDIDGKISLEITYTNFISNTVFWSYLDPKTNELPNGLKLYAYNLSPWQKPITTIKLM